MIVRPVPDLAITLATLLPQTAGPYIAMVLVGFAVGILGHLTASRWLVAAGIGLIVFGAFLFPLAINLTEPTPPELRNR
jgi:hypothetical protein